MKQAKTGEASHTRERSLVGVTPALLHECLKSSWVAITSTQEEVTLMRARFGEESMHYKHAVSELDRYKRVRVELRKILGLE